MRISNKNLRKLIEDDGYYQVSLILRSKDFENGMPDFIEKNKKEYLIKYWLINTYKVLCDKLPLMIKYADLLNGRLYLSLNKMSFKKTCSNMINYITELLTLYNGTNDHELVKRLYRMPSSLTRKDISAEPKSRRWLLDIDDCQDIEKIKNDIIQASQKYESVNTNGIHVYTKEFLDNNIIFNPTVTGTHVIGYIRDKDYTVDTIVLSQIAKDLNYDLKFNASTLLYKNENN